MKRKSQMVWLAGMAMSMPCVAQSDIGIPNPVRSSADASKAYHAELAANIANNASYLGQADPTVKISGQLQTRYLFNSRDSVPGGGEDTANGFQIRRAKVKFSGKVSDELSYKINGAFSKSSGAFKLEDAYTDYKASNGMKIRSGQFKLPFMREELVSSSRQLAAERSTTNGFFNQGRSQGVELSNSSENFRWMVAVSDGLGTINTDFTSSSEADYAITARAEYMLAGADWHRFKDFTSWTGSDFAAMIGGAATYESGGDTFGTVDTDLTGFTADVSVEGNGWNAFAAGNYQNVEPAVGADVENWGFVGQGGYMVNPTWEVFGRYDVLISDLMDDFSTVTVGVNHYIIPESHAAKFTGDVVFFLDAQSLSDAPASTSTALLPSSQDSQWAVRLQMQLLF